MYTARILKTASRELAHLDKPIARRIVERIYWLTENLDNANPKALKGDLAGLYKLREGITASSTRFSAKRKSSSFTASVIAEKFIKRSKAKVGSCGILGRRGLFCLKRVPAYSC